MKTMSNYSYKSTGSQATKNNEGLINFLPFTSVRLFSRPDIDLKTIYPFQTPNYSYTRLYASDRIFVSSLDLAIFISL